MRRNHANARLIHATIHRGRFHQHQNQTGAQTKRRVAVIALRSQYVTPENVPGGHRRRTFVAPASTGVPSVGMDASCL